MRKRKDQIGISARTPAGRNRKEKDHDNNLVKHFEETRHSTYEYVESKEIEGKDREGFIKTNLSTEKETIAHTQSLSSSEKPQPSKQQGGQ